jgi:very-short-patch-repair endonuclease
MREDKTVLRTAAREMRRNMTPAEQLMWSHLRKRPLGFKFRRQVPIEQVIVDFACLSERVVIEIDGRHHLDDPQDRERDRWLTARGFRVLRFQNQTVLEDLESVLQTIQQHLAPTA